MFTGNLQRYETNNYQDNNVERKLNDLLLKDQAHGKVKIMWTPVFVTCVSNFFMFLDFFRKTTTLSSVSPGTKVRALLVQKYKYGHRRHPSLASCSPAAARQHQTVFSGSARSRQTWFAGTKVLTRTKVQMIVLTPEVLCVNSSCIF
jgi:hypothetical protein